MPGKRKGKRRGNEWKVGLDELVNIAVRDGKAMAVTSRGLRRRVDGSGEDTCRSGRSS